MKKIYTPLQSSIAGLLGGPLSAYYCLKTNYKTLGNQTGESKTNLYGIIILAAFFLLTPFLPEGFPNMAIPIGVAVFTHGMAKQYQMEKKDIVESGLYDPKSNWNVLLVIIAGMALTFAILLPLISIYNTLGIITL